MHGEKKSCDFPSNLTRPAIAIALASAVFAVIVLSQLAQAQMPPAGVGWMEEVLHSFNPNYSVDGGAPWAGLIFDPAGNLYGTAVAGGYYAAGMVFQLTPSAGGGWTERVLHSFNGADGYEPQAALLLRPPGNLYSTTAGGGAYGYGTVFELRPGPHVGGSWTETVLHNFNNDGTDGIYPFGRLISDSNGNLFGTTNSGGLYGYGTVFELTPTANGWSEKVLHSFKRDGTDGIVPCAGLVFDAVGDLFGTTLWGGAYGYGTVFELTPEPGGAWTEEVLHSFNGEDGARPNLVDLIFDALGNLYGTTSHGGTYGLGTVFELTPGAGGEWTEQVLHSFGGGAVLADGSIPYAGVIFDRSGKLYGTTAEGGANDDGTVFQLKPQSGGGWTEQVLYSFDLNGIDAAFPWAPLIFDTAGNLYGTTINGGIYRAGAVFELIQSQGP